MKTRLTLLLLLITFIAHSQYDYYYHEPTLVGGGVGSNLVSVVGNDITPAEISMRLRIKRKHTHCSSICPILNKPMHSTLKTMQR